MPSPPPILHLLLLPQVPLVAPSVFQSIATVVYTSYMTNQPITNLMATLTQVRRRRAAGAWLSYNPTFNPKTR